MHAKTELIYHTNFSSIEIFPCLTMHIQGLFYILHALFYEVMPNFMFYMYLIEKDKLCAVLVKSACNIGLSAWEDLPIFPWILQACLGLSIFLLCPNLLPILDNSNFLILVQLPVHRVEPGWECKAAPIVGVCYSLSGTIGNASKDA